MIDRFITEITDILARARVTDIEGQYQKNDVNGTKWIAQRVQPGFKHDHIQVEPYIILYLVKETDLGNNKCCPNVSLSGTEA
jgi:hypothetical protein